MWCFPNGNHVTCGLQVQQIRLRGGACAAAVKRIIRSKIRDTLQFI